MVHNKVETVEETMVRVQCVECGQWMELPVESYLMECDRCLSKRDE